ncbi:hypothetical protein KK120_12900 [Virgibacillus dakarensis]|nr:hypothetical protein [Virgibacillus dakarensis]
MSEVIHCIVEYNEDGYLIFVGNYPGAYVRGKTKEEALRKMPDEIQSYFMWARGRNTNLSLFVKVMQEKKSELQISDADSDVLFESEKDPLSREEYFDLKSLALKSAKDFKTLYDSIPDKDITNRKPRKTFHGRVPLTANEILTHTNNVTSYYIREIGTLVENNPDIYENRLVGLKCVETLPNYLENQIFKGSYDELWTLRKVMRRFIWHDRIHAKAMYRMGVAIWGKDVIANPYFF